MIIFVKQPVIPFRYQKFSLDCTSLHVRGTGSGHVLSDLVQLVRRGTRGANVLCLGTRCSGTWGCLVFGNSGNAEFPTWGKTDQNNYVYIICKERKSSTPNRKLPEPAVHKYKHIPPQAHSRTALTDTDTYTRTNRLTNAETRDTDMLTHLPQR